MKTLYSGNWISAWQDNDVITIKYHPNVSESFCISQDDITKPAEYLFSAIERRLWLGRDYFIPTIKFCSYDGLIVEDKIYLGTQGYKRQATTQRNLKLILEDLDAQASDLHMDYLEVADVA